MFNKFGVVDNRSRKNGPIVKQAIPEVEGPFEKIVTCSCGAKLRKRCPSKKHCDLVALTCPKCGAEVV